MNQAGKRSDKQAGGFARAAALTPERRSEIAKEASLKRWAGVKKAAELAASVEVENFTPSMSTSG